jgi:hypothetical protein
MHKRAAAGRGLIEFRLQIRHLRAFHVVNLAVRTSSVDTPLGGEEYRSPSLSRYDPFAPPGQQALEQPGLVRIRRASFPSVSSRA